MGKDFFPLIFGQYDHEATIRLHLVVFKVFVSYAETPRTKIISLHFIEVQ